MSILSDGIAIADSITKSLGLQPEFTHYAWTGQDGKGKATYAAGVTRKGVIDLTRKQRTSSGGRLITIIATITVLETISANGAAGRREPVDPRDKIVLPDGTTGPILESPDAPVDPDTSKPFLNTIYLGEVA